VRIVRALRLPTDARQSTNFPVPSRRLSIDLCFAWADPRSATTDCVDWAYATTRDGPWDSMLSTSAPGRGGLNR
jgi:hypothetical protein